VEIYWLTGVSSCSECYLCGLSWIYFDSPLFKPGDETTWQNTVESDRPHMTIWRMLVSRWILKATNTDTHNM